MAKANVEGKIASYFETADLAAATVLFNIVRETMKRRQPKKVAVNAAKAEKDKPQPQGELVTQ